jgi:hypothetical protein
MRLLLRENGAWSDLVQSLLSVRIRSVDRFRRIERTLPVSVCPVHIPTTFLTQDYGLVSWPSFGKGWHERTDLS